MLVRRYNAKTHVTAGELRRFGFYMRETLSDRAFVRRMAVGLQSRERLRDGSATLGLKVLEPFVEPARN